MKRFLWKIAGAECQILEKSGGDSQRSFYIIGLLYLIVIFSTFIGFFGLFWGVFRGKVILENGDYSYDYPFVSALLGGLVLGFLVTNIYKLNLMSLEPNTLPVQKENSSKILTHFIRYSTIVLFAFFVSKNIEMEIVNILESSGIFSFDMKEGYMEHLLRMNREQPWVWVITILTILIFVAPVYLRHRLDRAHEYYSLKERRDIRLVLEHNHIYSEIKVVLYRKYYSRYNELYQAYFVHPNAPFFDKADELLSNKVLTIKRSLREKNYTEHAEIYDDEPFNTKKKVLKRKLESSEGFLKAILQNR